MKKKGIKVKFCMSQYWGKASSFIGWIFQILGKNECSARWLSSIQDLDRMRQFLSVYAYLQCLANTCKSCRSKDCLCFSLCLSFCLKRHLLYKVRNVWKDFTWNNHLLNYTYFWAFKSHGQRWFVLSQCSGNRSADVDKAKTIQKLCTSYNKVDG